MSSPDRYADLLAAQAAFGIDLSDQERLHRLQEQECSDYEFAAAACHVGWLGETEAVPDALMRKLREAGQNWKPDSSEASVSASPFGAADSAGAPAPSRSGAAGPQAPRVPVWMLAAAGLLAAFGAWTFLTNRSLTRQLASEQLAQAEARAAALAAADPAKGLEDLIARAPADLLRRPFGPGPDATGAAIEGEVFWTGTGQEGYMRLKGLAPNDASAEQYQLWIIDGKREGSPPVDGGVFDMPDVEGDVVIAIDAAVEVFEPTVFAVTVEKPGGVVVSKQERVSIAASAE